MQKYLKIFSLITLLTLICAPLAYANPQIVFDVNSGRVLAGEDIDQQWYPASLTKVMTGYLAFKALTERNDFTLKTKIKMSRHAADQPASKLGIGKGNSIRLEKALEALFIRSSNDIAMALAEHISGSEEKFLNLMNRTAQSLGMTRTHFSTPHGLFKKDQVSTARDLAKLSRAILTHFPQYAYFYKMHYLNINNKKFRNRNGLLRSYKGADGMKTGFVCSSGYNLIATATRGGKKIVAIMLGGKSVKSRNARVTELLDYGFLQMAKNINSFPTIYNAQQQQYKPPFDMRPISCAR